MTGAAVRCRQTVGYWGLSSILEKKDERRQTSDLRPQTWDFLPVISTNPVNLMNPLNPLNLLNPFTGSLSKSEHNPSTQPPDPQGRAPLNFL